MNRTAKPINHIAVSARILFVDEEEVLVRIDHKSKNPLRCKLAPAVDRTILEPGACVLLEGYICSRDVCYPNGCDCGTTSNGIETYLFCESVSLTVERCNDAQVSGIVVAPSRFVHTDAVDFLSARLQLDDGRGFLTYTDEKTDCVAAANDRKQIRGQLRTKDYNKKLTCPCCGKTCIRPTLSAWLVCHAGT